MTSLVRSLLTHGAIVDLVSGKNKTPFEEMLHRHVDSRPKSGIAEWIEFVKRVCLLLSAGANPTRRVPSLLAIVLYPTYSDRTVSKIASLYCKLVDVAVKSRVFSYAAVSSLYDDIRRLTLNREGLDDSLEVLRKFLSEGFTLKEMCRLKIRDSIRPPLCVNTMSGSIELPRQLKAYILFDMF
jgi:hypothetical protein